jgi:hypothetical protein
MSDSAITIIAIFLAAILMFVFPLMTMADKTDDVTELTVQTATTDFTNNIRTTGTLTQKDYDSFIMTLAATGNSYDVDITVQKLDENPAKKTSSSTTTIGDNVYYTMYTTQILDSLSSSSNNTLTLNEGDIVSVSVSNTNKTIANQLRNFMYKVTGNSSSTIAAEDSGIVTKSAN